MNVSGLGAFILGYEAYAMLTGHRTWTKMSADHDPKSIPVWLFLGWLMIHLLMAFFTKHD
jgi:hypothetical protein